MQHFMLPSWSSILSGAAALALLSGCSGAGGGDAAAVGTSREALRCYDANTGNPSSDGNCPWRDWSEVAPNNQPSLDISQEFAPALCASGNAGFLAISVDTGGHYRTLQFNEASTAGAWGSYGQKTFVTKPTCGLREDVTVSGQTRTGFVVAGKASDGKIYASAGTLANVTVPQQNPTANDTFTAIGNDVYSTGGNPALAGGNPAVGTGNAVALVTMGTDLQTIYGYSRLLPYPSHGWSARVQGPKLPSGWTSVGAPAIVQFPITFAIVVHAHNATLRKEAFFYTYFVAASSPPSFSNAIGSPGGTWAQLPLVLQAGQTINDDPSLTSDNTYGVTLWFRSNSQILQTASGSLPTVGSNPAIAIKPIDGVSFGSAPSAWAGNTYEEGIYVAIARDGSPTGTGHLQFITDTISTPGAFLGP
jgi:hypothetical protein